MINRSTPSNHGFTMNKVRRPTSAADTGSRSFAENRTVLTTATVESPSIKNPLDAQLHAFALQEHLRKSEIAELESLGWPLNQNLRWARRAKVHVRAQLTDGSNALPDAKLSQEDAKARYATMQKEFTARMKESIQRGSMSARFALNDPSRPVVFLKTREMARLMSHVLKKHRFAVCSYQSAAAYCYLIDRVPPGTRVELCQFVGSDHEVVAIGLRPNADLKDTSTWGPNTVICDTWADLEYPLSQLAEMRRPENDVKRHVGSASQHYLAGHLCAYGEYYGLPMES